MTSGNTLHSKAPISVFIIAKDEGDRIGQAIESVIDWVDEVIVIDSGSQDDTVQIAKSCGATVFFNAWQGYGQQKRFGEDQCQNDWILNIDADERVSNQAKEEIIHILSAPSFSGYRVDIVDIMPYEKTPRRFAWSVNQIRLYNIKQGRFRAHSTHDAVVMDEVVVGRISAPFYHRSIRSFDHLVGKINFYTELQAKDLKEKGRKVGAIRLLAEFPLAFLKCYFLRRYFVHGLYGLSFAIIFAFSKFLRLAKLYEKQLIEKADH